MKTEAEKQVTRVVAGLRGLSNFPASTRKLILHAAAMQLRAEGMVDATQLISPFWEKYGDTLDKQTRDEIKRRA